MRDDPNVSLKCQTPGSMNPQKVCVDEDSKKVVMEVETLSGVCNNSLAESACPENG